MSVFLEDVFDYRRLVGNRALFNECLDSLACLRLAELTQRVANQCAAPDEKSPQRRYKRSRVALSGAIAIGRTSRRLVVHDLGAGGVRVRSGPVKWRRGAVALLGISDSAQVWRYQFLSMVAWTQHTRYGAIAGLEFVGPPRRQRA